jgi:hypothetical protein
LSVFPSSVRCCFVKPLMRTEERERERERERAVVGFFEGGRQSVIYLLLSRARGRRAGWRYSIMWRKDWRDQGEKGCWEAEEEEVMIWFASAGLVYFSDLRKVNYIGKLLSGKSLNR